MKSTKNTTPNIIKTTRLFLVLVKRFFLLLKLSCFTPCYQNFHCHESNTSERNIQQNDRCLKTEISKKFQKIKKKMLKNSTESKIK